jgi:hypothetical protein
MPLLAVLDEAAHGALDDSLKSLYVQNTDTKEFHLDVAPDEAAKLAHNLRKQFDSKKTDLDRVHREKKELADKIAAFEGLGKTADEIKELINSKRPEDVAKLVEAHRLELEQTKASFEEPMVKLKDETGKLRQQIEQQMTQAAIQKLRNEFDLNETADYVLRDFIKVVPKEEGSAEYVTKVVGGDGQEMLVAGQPIGPDGLIKNFQEAKKFPAMFNAGSGGGTGVTNNTRPAPNSTGKTMKWSQFESMPMHDQEKFFTDGGVTVAD